MEDGEARERITEFIEAEAEPWAAPPHLRCSAHPDEEALPCRVCAKLSCCECLTPSGKGGFVCQECLAKERKSKHAERVRHLLELPAFWVILCILVSGVAYSFGIGNPGLDDIARIDEGREWYKKEAAKLSLAQGARERKRAAILKRKGDIKDAMVWSLRAAESYSHAASLWGDAPSAFAPALASAEAFSFAGETSKALELVKSVKKPEAVEDIPSYHFVCARIGEAAGDTKYAKDNFRDAISSARKANESIVETVIDSLTKTDRREAGMSEKVRLASGLCHTMDEIVKESRKSLGPEKDGEEKDGDAIPEHWRMNVQRQRDDSFEIEMLDSKKEAP